MLINLEGGRVCHACLGNDFLLCVCVCVLGVCVQIKLHANEVRNQLASNCPSSASPALPSVVKAPLSCSERNTRSNGFISRQSTIANMTQIANEIGQHQLLQLASPLGPAWLLMAPSGTATGLGLRQRPRLRLRLRLRLLWVNSRMICHALRWLGH